jgi:hypothetical protein
MLSIDVNPENLILVGKTGGQTLERQSIPDTSTWTSLNMSAMIKLNSLSELRVRFISEFLFLDIKLNVGSLPVFCFVLEFGEQVMHIIT